jgi:hypothetical protein
MTNKTLSFFLLAAIVVSVSGSFIIMSDSPGGITGFATTGTGKTNFSINSSLSIIVNQSLIPFGVGHVNDTATWNSCFMGTNNSPPSPTVSGCIGFNATVHTANITIVNDGNILANVSVRFDKNATTFIGGTAATPYLKYRVSDFESGSCGQLRNASTAVFKEVDDVSDTAAGRSRICNALKATPDSTDSIQLGIWVNIPKDAIPGEHTNTLTFTACDDASC